MNTARHQELLRQELALMHRAAKILELSWQRCAHLTQNVTYPLEEIDCLELLSSRFSRLTDFIIQRIFRLIDEIDLEATGTVRDTIHRAEKKGLIADANTFIEARILRNKIAHEYIEEVMTAIFLEVQRLTPYLLDTVQRVDKYCERYTAL